MEFIHERPYKRIFLEWIQPTNLVNSMLKRILHSKRLLADHIEILEQCQIIPIDETNESFSTKPIIAGGCGLFTLAAISAKANLKCLHILVPIASATYSVYLSIEAIIFLKSKLTQRRLNATLTSIDCVDVAIRKNISYFRELKILSDPSTIDRRCNRSGNCLKSIAGIVRIIYAEVKRLELILLPAHVEELYEPLEELSTCIYFQQNIDEFTSDDIKAFYNFFLYFQSQFLTRLCLILFYIRCDGLNYINDANVRFRKLLSKNTNNLSAWLNETVKQQQMATKIRTTSIDAMNTDSLDLVKMKRSSMDILCRLIAITNQYQNTDHFIQMLESNTKQAAMVDILNDMKRLNESIVACQDDFETLKLIYIKCLAKKFNLDVESESESEEQLKTIPAASELQEPKHEQSAIKDDSSQEYFALRNIKNGEDSDTEDSNIESDNKRNRREWCDELDNIDMKVTRSFFAPVLKQLKTKIVPIKDEMKEREMKFLLSKGVDRQRILELHETEEDLLLYKRQNDRDENSGSESDSYDENKIKRQQHRYDEQRTFLEQKQPIRFMMPLANLPPCGSEEVLE